MCRQVLGEVKTLRVVHRKTHAVRTRVHMNSAGCAGGVHMERGVFFSHLFTTVHRREEHLEWDRGFAADFTGRARLTEKRI